MKTAAASARNYETSERGLIAIAPAAASATSPGVDVRHLSSDCPHQPWAVMTLLMQWVSSGGADSAATPKAPADPARPSDGEGEVERAMCAARLLASAMRAGRKPRPSGAGCVSALRRVVAVFAAIHSTAASPIRRAPETHCSILPQLALMAGVLAATGMATGVGGAPTGGTATKPPANSIPASLNATMSRFMASRWI